MSPTHGKQENYADLVAKYTRPRTPTVLELGRTALGTELANGYTTLAQARQMAEALELGEGDVLLDLGAGRAWPGVHIAQTSGCRLVTTDLTLEAVAEAQPHLAGGGLAQPPSLLPANAIALPFKTGIFNAVVHADVLC